MADDKLFGFMGKVVSGMMLKCKVLDSWWGSMALALVLTFFYFVFLLYKGWFYIAAMVLGFLLSGFIWALYKGVSFYEVW